MIDTTYAARLAAGLAVMFGMVWNADVRAWLGVPNRTDHYLALILGPSLCAQYFSKNVSNPKVRKAAWWVAGFVALVLFGYLCVAFRFSEAIDQLAPRPSQLVILAGLSVLLMILARAISHQSKILCRSNL